jgi:hypothetical protein
VSDKLEATKQSITATLSEISTGEAAFKQQHGVEIADADEWQSLGEIVRRLEAKWLAAGAAAAAEEVA